MRGFNVRQSGFTLLELMVAFTVAGLLLAVSVPASHKMYQGMQYRGALSEIRNLFESARYQALMRGRAVDVVIAVETRELSLLDVKSVVLPDGLRLSVNTAVEMMRDDGKEVIRFYPDGMSTGGRVTVLRSGSHGVSFQVGWLLGEVGQHTVTVEEAF